VLGSYEGSYYSREAGHTNEIDNFTHWRIYDGRNGSGNQTGIYMYQNMIPSEETAVELPNNENDTTDSQTPTISIDTQTNNSEAPIQKEIKKPVELPYPTSDTFGLEGLDAVLYNAAANLYSTLTETPDLLMPSLAYLDSYQTEDGKTCCICLFKQCDYFNLGYGLDDLDNPKCHMSGGKLLTRLTIEKSETGEMVCTDIFPSYDPQVGYEKAVCGPKTELAEAFANGTELPVEERWITPSDPKELLAIYIDYYFR
jgi:hypothetical protein